jgi:hypothetical protein
MSLSKIPFIVAALVGVHITYTPPVPPALEHERKSEPVRLGPLTKYITVRHGDFLILCRLSKVNAFSLDSGHWHSQKLLR